jgi:hypothetical protein
MTTTEMTTPETTLATVDKNSPLALSLLPSAVMRPILDEYTDRRKTFRRWLKEQLTEGIHYGIPPGCEPKYDGDGNTIVDGKILDPYQWQVKPSLYKAGADFLCDLMQMDPQFSPDIETWKMLGAKEGTIVICCRLLSRGDSPFFTGRVKGDVLGEGRGAGVAGVKRRDGNGAIKIAQKSAKIDAVINTLGLSDLFTQDLEDETQRGASPAVNTNAPKVAPRAERQQQSGSHPLTAKLNGVFSQWRSRFGSADSTTADFSAWACSLLRTDKDLMRVSNWSIDAIDVVAEALK